MKHPYLPNTDDDRKEMLRKVGVERIEQLFEDIPQELQEKATLHLPPMLSEPKLVRHLKELAEKNVNVEDVPCFLGAGIYDHFSPSIVKHLLRRGEFYTAYTPYQPEASQGTLQAMFEFQSLICQLTGMEVSNASLYDGASALAEAVLMAYNVMVEQRQPQRTKVILPKTLHPHYAQVVKTHGDGLGLEWAEVPYEDGITDADAVRSLVDERTCCVVVQHPNFFGCLERVGELEEAAHKVGALFVVVFDPISLGILKPPGEYGADIAVAEGQSLGIPPSFGGPGVGVFTCRKKFIRQMPGRIVGETVDAKGRRGFVLTLQTREQHIRREKATSNICTNQSLMALAATVYLATMGPHGLRRVAELCAQNAHYLARRLSELEGFSLPFSAPFFKEFVLRCPTTQPPNHLTTKLLEHGIVGGLPLGRCYPELADCMLFCVTEKRTKEEIDQLIEVMC